MSRQSLGVWLLAIGQTLGFACMFYSFAALILSLDADLGWDKRLFALGPMLAIGISAVLAPVMGRLVDSGRGQALLVAGAVLGGIALFALAQVRTPAQYLSVWAVIGLAQSACLYDVAFAYLVRRYGTEARPRIIRVTLVAGLASTIAFPAGALLAESFGWRGAVLVGAAVMLLITAPAHWFACQWIRAATVVEIDVGGSKGVAVAALRRSVFWGLAGLFGLVGLNHWILINFLVPLLLALGVSHGWAVLAASLVGPSQTLGRFVLMQAEARIGTKRALLITIGMMLAASAALAGVGASGLLIFVFATLQGGAMGIMTILRPVLVADALGRAQFGAINGMLSISSLGASAIAPLVAAALFEGAGPMGMIGASFAMALAALGLAHWLVTQA
ncbi:MFS transporter [Pseudorhodobacter sp.]|uniref:MFS transporter n=1 Tax=Pseudorhodobacter sp. TaxID=1934400 RepID=UPI002648236C|nr:MFS transporter [Pseudorhodobacter sp.]MDN5787705.1 MFS transporter [Pseudorhodobacter sp.]